MVGWGRICPSWGRKPKRDLSSAVWGRSRVKTLASPILDTSDAQETFLGSCWVSLSFRWSLSPSMSRGWASLHGRGLVPPFPGWCGSPSPRQHPEAPTALVLAGSQAARRGDQSREADILHTKKTAWGALNLSLQIPGASQPLGGPQRDLLVTALPWDWFLLFLGRSWSPSDLPGSAQPGTSVGRNIKLSAC